MSGRAKQFLQRMAFVALACALCASGAQAAATVRAAKAVAEAFTFIPLNVGVEKGIFAKYGVDVPITSFTGDAKMQEGLASDSVDVGLGGGPAMAFAAKGAPVLAVAAFGGAPRDISVIVKWDSPIKTVADLRGKSIACSTVGSLTAWLSHQIAIKNGWGQNGVQVVATGAGPAMISAIITGAVDAGMGATETALTLEQRHQGRLLVSMDKYEPEFITHVIFARKQFIRDHPKELADFLKGFFASLAYMRTHKAETVAIAHDVLHEDKAILDKVYDFEMPMLLKNGEFPPAGLKVIKESFLAMGTLSKIPPDSEILTRRFVPVKF